MSEMNDDVRMNTLEEENRQLRDRLSRWEQEKASLEAEVARLTGEMQRLRRRMGGSGSSMSTKLQDALRE
ncbi:MULTISPECIES: hypothetical protein [unclassified Paenibacillus]|uniref:hypothetical protein n=1 Tax=unclassified Paenibacillus TaxID=185978 RepID=UPI0009554FAC|nr:MULTISPECIES: hypothetical protein [unclassified Paenibacillus]ASS66851.1 hypothetical protein CIC07_12270 [Paenibacillus sp. RUD330]SIP93442.1 hypothetical protein SAMN05880555_0022 [Paenibacillus sp. RU4X]SIQ11987.1 hypothetical protein SAMN05880570_0022 [Paenibacillus sp. RU4T]